ncbi:MAG: glycosyltransferase [Proteobacteria bacterium]|nr:glycosyltransferase [Pseudomonadota bacterium]MBI3497941.1 glycosyltransferase [Pseudomonadota bacterium]
MRDLQFTVLVSYLDQVDAVRDTVGAIIEALAPFPKSEVLLVDNGSTDGSHAILDELAGRHPKFRWVLEERRGVYYARRRGLLDARSELCIFIDDDAVPTDAFFEEILEVWTSDPKIGVVGGRVELDPSVQVPTWVPQRLLSQFAVWEGGRQTGVEDAIFPILPTGVALAVRRGRCTELWCGDRRAQNYPLGRRKADPGRGVAGSDLGGEESDLCLVFMRSGYRVLFAHDARARLRVPVERLRPGWFIGRFGSEGRTRIRLLRLAGLNPMGRFGRHIIWAWPLLALVLPIAMVIAPKQALVVRAYLAKSWHAFGEWAFGPRYQPFPYRAD